ncbi:MAG: polymer-forming cytoskeletal protein [Planctomycetota bacterium]|nr:polymer-forming cytoskeletal protein [Planctomycetota bacterium]
MLRLPPGLPAISLFRTPATRRVWCPRCDHLFHASAKAISLRCPSCTAAVEPKDLSLTHSLAGEVTAIGRVVVPATMKLTGKLTCAELDNAGFFKGKARVGGAVELQANSQTVGELSCRSLSMAAGARVHCTASIGKV